MAFDFPSSPSNGQVFDAGPTRYQWNGYAWIMQSGNIGPAGPTGPAGPEGPPGTPGPTGGVTIDVGDVAPSTPADNSLWWKSDSGALWLRYNDGNSVQWLQVNSNLILPPQDGNEYVMRNGLWRLKSQSLDLVGASAVNIPVPAGAKLVKLDGTALMPTATNTSLVFRVSLDGSTFMQAAADYTHGGFIHYTGSTPTAVTALGSSFANGYLTYNGTNAFLPHMFRGLLMLTRVSGGRFDMNCVGSCYGASGWQTSVNRIEVMETNAGSNLAIKMVQILSTPAIAFGSPATLDIEWVY